MLGVSLSPSFLLKMILVLFMASIVVLVYLEIAAPVLNQDICRSTFIDSISDLRNKAFFASGSEITNFKVNDCVIEFAVKFSSAGDMSYVKFKDGRQYPESGGMFDGLVNVMPPRYQENVGGNLGQECSITKSGTCLVRISQLGLDFSSCSNLCQ